MADEDVTGGKRRGTSDEPLRASTTDADSPLGAFTTETVEAPALTVVDLGEWTSEGDPLAAFGAECLPERSDRSDRSIRSDRSNRSSRSELSSDHAPPDDDALTPTEWIESELVLAAARARRVGRFGREIPSLARQMRRDYGRPIAVRLRQLQVGALVLMLRAVSGTIRVFHRIRVPRANGTRRATGSPHTSPIRPPIAVPEVRTVRAPASVLTPRTIRTPRRIRTARTIRTTRTLRTIRLSFGIAALALVALATVAALNSMGDAVGRWFKAASQPAQVAETGPMTAGAPDIELPDPDVVVNEVAARDAEVVDAPTVTLDVPAPTAAPEPDRRSPAAMTPSRVERQPAPPVAPARPTPTAAVEPTTSRPPAPPPPTAAPAPAPRAAVQSAPPPSAETNPAPRPAQIQSLTPPGPTATTGVAPPSPSSNIPPAVLPAAPAVTPVTSAAAATPPASATRTVPPAAAIETVLNRYAFAFSVLDAQRAKAVWPTVNERNLERAFDSLENQRFDLGECDIDVAASRAVASCYGTARYTPKVGNRKLRVERRQWTFQLQQRDQEWTIESVNSRQQ